MSLINDALKRAREAQTPKPPEVEPLPPVEAEPGCNVGRLLLIAVMVLLIGACFFIGLALSKNLATRTLDHPTPVATAPTPAPGQPAAPVAMTAPAPASAKPETATAPPAPPAPAVASAPEPAKPEPATAAPAVVVPVPETNAALAKVAETNLPAATNLVSTPPPPAFKLQGIVYNSTRPWAIVNGKSVYRGDRVNDRQVKDIQPGAVILQGTNGSELKLVLNP